MTGSLVNKNFLHICFRILLKMARLFMCLSLGLIFFDVALGKATFSDCGGENKKLTLKNGAVHPDPIQYPGNLTVDADLDVLEDLPSSNLVLKLHLTKLQPRSMLVPCLDGFGSCEYDVCKLIEAHKDELCPAFPPGSQCACPLKKASYAIRNAFVTIPDFGEIFVHILQGGYAGNLTFIDKNSNTEVGCVNIAFNIVPHPSL